MATAKTETEDVPCCPICLEQFSIPRQLPCAHSFCEKCLQSHITTEATKQKELRYVQCPVCRNYASPTIKDRPPSEWASLFPANSVLQPILIGKIIVDHLCDACNSEGVSVPAEGFCPACKEAMCADCLKFHKKQRISKDHTILSVVELARDPENVMKFAEGFTCSEHHGEDIKYYCKDDSVPCCGTCFFQGHKLCTKVIDLKEELPALLHESKPDEIIGDIKRIETDLKNIIEMNESSVKSVEFQVNSMTDQIREIRKKINAILEQLEERVKTEGNRIYKEEIIRIQEENHHCLSLIHAVRNSQYLLEAIYKYGSNLQKFLMLDKMRSQVHSYSNVVREKYEKKDTMRLEVEFAPPVQSILSLSLSELGKIVTTTSCNPLLPTCMMRPTKDCRVERVDVIDLKVPTGKRPNYYGITFLPGDRVMLVDYSNCQCILLSSSYQFITSHAFTCNPGNICVLDDQEVAVSLHSQNKIQILSVLGDIIRPVRTITTKYRCDGIASAGNGKMVVTGCCGNGKCYWSLISTAGVVKHSTQYDSPSICYYCIALNNTNTKVYIPLYAANSLVCFTMDGTKQFTYSPDNLRGPFGVAVDRFDNIYVLGYVSNNIHQLSLDGSVIQVITSGVPKSPCAIGIHKSKDVLIITNGSDATKLNIYQFK